LASWLWLSRQFHLVVICFFRQCDIESAKHEGNDVEFHFYSPTGAAL
jgi:hypothetical protein